MNTDKPRAVAVVEVEEKGVGVLYSKIDPEVVKRIENIERMLTYIYNRDTGDQ